ncbi:hypothetical protein [Pseudomonas sp.]|jgi:hypothetical protein|uniref:DUF7673 family protein n=1 Tax=Pseudomonas sp. TaxID=306 RepID=UPI003242A401
MTATTNGNTAHLPPDEKAEVDRLIQFLEDQRRDRDRVRMAGVGSLKVLVDIALGHTGQCRVVGRFLLGLYSGPQYRFDLTDLRMLDAAVHEHCIKVLWLDHTLEREIEKHITDGEAIWQQLISMWGRNDD